MSWHRNKAELTLDNHQPPVMDLMLSPLPSPTSLAPSNGPGLATSLGSGTRPVSPFRPGLRTATLVSVPPSLTSNSRAPPSAFDDGHQQGPPRKRRSMEVAPDSAVSQTPQSPTLSSNSRDRPKKAERRASQRSMLSVALQKANTAVVLDNQLCYNAAIPAYEEAAALLEKVLRRVGGNAERSKLAEIRQTYLQRAFDLSQEPRDDADEKALPARPLSSNPRDSFVPSLKSSNSFRIQEHASPIIPEVEEEMPSFSPISAVYNGVPEAINPAESHPQPDAERALSIMSRKSRSQSTIESFRIDPLVNCERESPSHATESPSASAPIPTDHGQLPPVTKGMLHLNLVPPALQNYVPGPLTPRKFTTSPTCGGRPSSAQLAAEATAAAMELHSRSDSEGTTSWLDTIDESGDSDSDTESVHSRSSTNALRRKRLRAARTRTQVKYDQAYDAVFAAAYGDELTNEAPTDPAASSALRKVDLARDMVRQAEIEAELQRSQSLKQQTRPLHIDRSPNRQHTGIDFGYAAAELEEEEHMLADMSKIDTGQSFGYGQATKPMLPRQSASTHHSQNSRTTFTSSIASSATTAGTSLSTLADITNSTLPILPKDFLNEPLHLLPPLNPPPTSALPPLPPSANIPIRAIKPPSHPSSLSSSPSRQGLRERRRSGSKVPFDLKIETPSTRSRAPTPGPRTVINILQDSSRPSSRQTNGPLLSASAMPIRQSSLKMQGVLTSLAPPSLGGRQISSPLPQSASPIDPLSSSAIDSGDTSVSRSFFQSDAESGSPMRFHMKRSSDHLKQKLSTQNLRTHLVVDPMLRAPSPQVSSTANFSRRKGSTPMGTPMLPTSSILPAIPNGFQLFDRSFLSEDPSSPSGFMPNERPAPLEPCPQEANFRPFWLMRAIQRTLTHPKGGYLTNTLFIPSAAWQTKNVKLKNVEDKISQLDLLSAALGNLNRAQHDDVEGVLKEMQLLENQLDLVQATLTKRLGSEVGFQSLSALTKDAAPSGVLTTVDESGTVEGGQSLSRVPTNTATIQSSKTRSDGGVAKTSTASRWKIILRGKSVSASAGTSGSVGSAGRRYDAAGNETSPYALSSVPLLAANSDYQPPHLRRGRSHNHSLSTRSASHLGEQFPPTAQSLGVSEDIIHGANGSYAAAIARCCDAVQALDLVARQVEDPGLKHSSPIQVGLELSAKHASEFFGGWVCRFVLADLGTLVDKYIKRGGEWVLA